MILVIVEPVLGRRKGKREFIAATFFEANTGGDYANLAASYQTGKEEGKGEGGRGRGKVSYQTVDFKS